MVPGAEARGLSLIHGGPIHALARRVGLSPTDPKGALRLALALVAIAWLPAVALAIVERALGGAWDPLVVGARMHARLLVALPLLVLAELSLESRCAAVTRQLVRAAILPDASRAPFASLIARIERARDARWAELAVILVVYALTAASVADVLPHRFGRWLFSAGHRIGMGPRFTPAATWYLLVGEPLFLVLLLRWLGRWSLWAWLLARLPALGARTEPAHADRAGGLAFLGSPLFAVRLVWLSVGVALAAVWFDEVAERGVMPAAFAGDLVLFLALALVLAALPYLTLTPHLVAAQREGALTYSALVRRYVEHFDARWLGGREPAPDMLETSEDFSGLADIGTSLEVVLEMRSTIFDVGELRRQALVALVPFAPIVLVNAGSAAELLKRIFAELF